MKTTKEESRYITVEYKYCKATLDMLGLEKKERKLMQSGWTMLPVLVGNICFRIVLMDGEPRHVHSTQTQLRMTTKVLF